MDPFDGASINAETSHGEESRRHARLTHTQTTLTVAAASWPSMAWGLRLAVWLSALVRLALWNWPLSSDHPYDSVPRARHAAPNSATEAWFGGLCARVVTLGHHDQVISERALGAL